MAYTVMVVDDHEIVRVGLASVLADAQEFELLALVGTAHDAIEALGQHRPNVLILDARLPDGSGLDIVPKIRELAPGTRILILTSYGEERAVIEAVAAGVDGFLVKTADSRALIEAVLALAQGRPILREQVADSLLRFVRREGSDQAPSHPPLLERLTPREMEVAALVANGFSNAEVGLRLGITEKTVRNHVSDVLSKFGMERRTQIMMALRDLDPESR